LVGLTSFIRELSESPLTPEQKELAANSSSCVATISGLITHLLDFSLIDAKQLTMRREIFNVASTTHFMCALLHRQARDKSINLKTNLPDLFSANGSLFVYGDTLRYQQIITNLTSNAIKYTASGGTVTLTFRTEMDEPPILSKQRQKLNICFSVSDTGIGIPANEIPHIFKPFYQVKRMSGSTITTNTNSAGAGIGLYIVSEIVKALNASISVKSSEKGTTMIVDDLSFDIATPEELSMTNTVERFFTPEAAE